jgi:hypothetical protein
MTDDRRPGTDEPEPASLGVWGSNWVAPPELRQATLNAARERGLVKGDRMSGRGFWMGTVAAAAAVMFVVGFGLGSRQSGRTGGDTMTNSTTASAPAATPAVAAGQKYALFLFEDANYQTPAEGQMMDRVREYGGWARGLAESGRFVDGEKLGDDGRYCRMENGTLTAAGPQSDARRGALTGYFVIGAASLDEAQELAKSCPHLKYGGTLEIRLLETS